MADDEKTALRSTAQKSDEKGDPKGKAMQPSPDVPRSTKAIALCLLATALLTAVDLGSKHWAEENLSQERATDPPPVCEPGSPYQRLSTQPVVLIEDSLELRYAENCGAAFSMLQSAPAFVRTGIFGLAAVIAIIALSWMFIKGRGGPWFAAAVPLVVSGAAGNVADRFRLGYVIDFIRFHWDEPIFGYTEWPTFNIADSTILIGVLFLLIDSSVEQRKEKRASAAASATS